MKTMEDAEDIGLKAVMGNHFIDLSSQAPTKPHRRRNKNADEEEAQDAAWVPVRTTRTDLERLEAACKAMLPYAGACAVLWWWQIEGSLDAGVSQAASTLCAVIASMAATRAWFKP